jgi:OmpA-OmpF porin, OOP family
VAQLKSGTFRLKGTAASLEGNAPTPGVYIGVTSAMRKLPAGGRTALVDVLPPPADPYLFSVQNSGSTIVLQGYVPSPDLRHRLISAAQTTGKKVGDRLVYASGAHVDFEAAATTGIKLAALLHDSALILQGNTFSFKGEASNHGDYNGARTLLANFPRSVRPAGVNVSPPLAKPYMWSVERNGPVVRISGFVPDEAAHAELERQAKVLFPGATVANEAKIARGTPDGDFIGAAKLALQHVQKMTSGRVDIVDDTIKISGAASDYQAAEHLRKSPQHKAPRGMKLAAINVSAPLPEKVLVDLPPPAPLMVPPGLAAEGKVRVEGEVRTRIETAAGTGMEKQPPDKPSTDIRGVTGSDAACAALVSTTAPVSLYFVSGTRKLLAQSREPLRMLVAKAVEMGGKCPATKIILKGHADFKGARRDNMILATGRTFTIKRVLVKAGFKRSQIETLSYGEDRPVADNTTFDGRVKNRRVVVEFK